MQKVFFKHFLNISTNPFICRKTSKVKKLFLRKVMKGVKQAILKKGFFPFRTVYN